MRNALYLLLVGFFLLLSCHDDPTEEKLETPVEGDTTSTPPPVTPPVTPPAGNPILTQFFPGANGEEWEKLPPDSLKWNLDSLNTLISFLESKNTYGFIILYKGRIVTEKYWNNWTPDTKYPVASAGKSVVAFLTGIAQEQGLLKISEKTSTYLGEDWSSLPDEKEDLIMVRHQLTMTTGLDETDNDCVSPSCLTYKADAGERWAYHNAPYHLLQKVIETTSGVSMSDFTKTNLADRIGMKNWTWTDYNIDLSTRDMARFGLLVMNKGKWGNDFVMRDSAYFKAMTSSSNGLNKSYGYLWWLNGKESYMVPTENDVKSGPLTPPAPGDMFAAMGKGDKKIYIVPGMQLVIVRHGDDTGIAATLGPSSFDSEFWKRFAPVIKTMPDNF